MAWRQAIIFGERPDVANAQRIVMKDPKMHRYSYYNMDIQTGSTGVMMVYKVNITEMIVLVDRYARPAMTKD
jgi:hypothetical protein